MSVYAVTFDYDPDYWAGVIMADTEAEAVARAAEVYDDVSDSSHACLLDQVPSDQLPGLLRRICATRKGFRPVDDISERVRRLSVSECQATLTDLARWVTDRSAPFPLLRLETEYDQRSDAEALHWIAEARLGRNEADLEVRVAIRSEVRARYDAARMAGAPVPEGMEAPAAFLARREKTRSLFERLVESKTRSGPPDLESCSTEDLRRMLFHEGVSLPKVAALFETTPIAVMSRASEERPRRRKRPSNSFAAFDFMDRGAYELIADVNMGEVQGQIEKDTVPAAYTFPVSRRTGFLFSLLVEHHEKSAADTFSHLVECLVAMERMSGFRGWDPELAALVMLGREILPDEKPGPTDDAVQNALAQAAAAAADPESGDRSGAQRDS